MRVMTTSVHCIILTVCCALYATGLVIHTPALQGQYNAPDITWLSKDAWGSNETISGELVYNKVNNITGQILLLQIDDTYDWGVLVDDAKSKGAIALVLYWGGTTPGALNYFKLNPDQQVTVEIPSVAIGISLFESMKDYFEQNSTFPLNVTLDRNDENLWKHTKETGSIVFSVVMGALALGAIALSVYKLYETDEKFSCGLSQTILIIEIVSNTIRFTYSVIDPIYSRRILISGVHEMFITGLPTLSIASSILIAFYWHELLLNIKTLRSVVRKNVHKLLIPCIIVIVAYTLMEFVLNVIRAATDLPFLLEVSGLCFALFSLSVSIYYFIIGTKVLLTIKRSKKQTARSRNMIKITYILLLSGVFIVLSVCLALFVFSSLFFTPAGFYSFWVFFYLLLYAVSYTQLLALQSSKKTPRDSTLTNGSATAPTVDSAVDASIMEQGDSSG